ncbi:hypothetical protein GCM10023097_74590 [Streptomyces collinus]
MKLDGDATPGRASDLTLTVTKDGKPVRNLQPCLGAYGHLVALRSGDLATAAGSGRLSTPRSKQAIHLTS